MRPPRPTFWRVVMWTGSVLAVGSAAAWIVARNREGWIGRPTWPRYATVHRGNVMIFSSIWDHPPPGVDEWIYDVLDPSTSRPWPSIRHIGNRYTIAGNVRWGARLWALEMPLWLPAVAGAAAAAAGAWRARPRPPFACPACGYSLNGLPQGTRCPECGK